MDSLQLFPFLALTLGTSAQHCASMAVCCTLCTCCWLWKQLSSPLQVYIDKTNVDDDLVRSIIRAAEEPNAAEVFYRVIGGNSGVTGGGASVNQLLNKLDNKMPMLLLWGDLDPWIGPGSAARVKKYYPKADRVGIQAGHCPHDEKPAEVDRILLDWASKL